MGPTTARGTPGRDTEAATVFLPNHRREASKTNKPDQTCPRLDERNRMKRPSKIRGNQVQPEPHRFLHFAHLSLPELGRETIHRLQIRAESMLLNIHDLEKAIDSRDDDACDILKSLSTQTEALRILEAEACFSRALSYLRGRAKSGNRDAVRIFHRSVETAVLHLNDLAEKHPETWDPIMELAMGWPIINSYTKEDRQRTDTLMARVGKKAPWRGMSPPGAGERAPKFSPETPLTRIAMEMITAFQNLTPIAGILRYGNPERKKFDSRVECLLQPIQKEKHVRALRFILKTLVEHGITKPRHITKTNAVSLCMAYLDQETDRHPEQILELRVQTAYANAWKNTATPEWESKICAYFRKLKGEPGQRERREFLLKFLGPRSVESNIRQAIKMKLAQHCSFLPPE